MRKLPRFPECFICGRENSAGTDVTFIATDDGVKCDYTAQEKHQSYKGILHGGVISALLDECMGWSVSIQEKKMFVTGELKVKYIRPVPVGKKITVKSTYGSSQDLDSDFRFSEGRVEDTEGTLFAIAEGKFHPVHKDFEVPIFAMLEKNNDPVCRVTPDDVWG